MLPSSQVVNSLWIIFFIRLPPGLLPVLGPLEWWWDAYTDLGGDAPSSGVMNSRLLRLLSATADDINLSWLYTILRHCIIEIIVMLKHIGRAW